ncbi:MAG TPA: hypothetical protein VMG41_01435 [Gemmatimonadales bacterium]|nr:hypothetical protein [Gemmatimonadales bacterium]
MADARPPQSPTPGQHDRSALLQAFQDVVRKEQQKTGAPEPEPKAAPSRSFWVVAGPLVVALCSVLVLQPAWLFPKPPPETPALRDASLRVRMYVEIEHIDAFRTIRGRLPTTIAEAGGDGNGLVYSAAGDSFSLSGRNGSVALTYNSSTPPHDFLGDSYRLIQQRRAR